MQRVEKAYYKEMCKYCNGTGNYNNRYEEEFKSYVDDCTFCDGKGYNIFEDWIEINEIYKEVLE
jgi:DnaJ-class molecular chaperone